MALSNADKQRAYRRRKAEAAVTLPSVTEIQQLQRDMRQVTLLANSMLLEIKEMRNVTGVTVPPTGSPFSDKEKGTQKETNSSPKIHPPLFVLSNELPLKGANARPKAKPPVKLADWQPSEKHRQLAYDEGHDDAWTDREAERYRDQQVNAKLKHRDREAGFRNWIRNAPNYERKPNGHANGQHKKSPVEKLYEGAFRAVAAREERRRARDTAADPLLDGGRSPSGPARSN